MIRVNLLPGGSKKAKRSGPSIRLPDLRGKLPKGDRWVVGAGLAVILFLFGSGWLFFSISGDQEELEVQIEAAVRDSIRFADIVAQSSLLQARTDSIAQRVAIIQQIDQGRYVWPHLMDEVARAIPEYAWLTRLFQVADVGMPVFQIEGRAGTYFALTSLMENLEASPFITGVQLIASEQVTVTASEDGGERLLYEFTLEASGEPPPPELIESVPLFGPSVAAPQAAGD